MMGARRCGGRPSFPARPAGGGILSTEAARSGLPRESAAARVRSLPTRLITDVLGNGRARPQDRPALGGERAGDLGRCRARRSPQVEGGVGAHRRDAGDRRCLPDRKPWTLPLKFLLPGTVFLLAFHVIPVIYTINVAFSNYSTGHILSRSEAIANIGRTPSPRRPTALSYSMVLLRDKDHNLVLGLVDQDTGKTYLGTRDGLSRSRATRRL